MKGDGRWGPWGGGPGVGLVWVVVGLCNQKKSKKSIGSQGR